MVSPQSSNMLLLQLQPCLLNQSVSLSYSRPTLSLNFASHTHQLPLCFPRQTISCSVSQAESYATVSNERRPVPRWKDVYKKLSMRENRTLGTFGVLDQWENDGKRLTKIELCCVVRELRKFRRYRRALEVYDWMTNRIERFPLSTSDAAILLDLIAKVRGVSQAEECFHNLPEDLKDKRIYGALLNAYVRARMKEKAESLFDKMKSKGYVEDSLSYSVMMNLYLKLKKYDKVDSVALEMINRKIPFHLHCYNIWVTSCGYLGSAEKMEEIFERMQQDPFAHPNWSTFNIMAAMYIKLGKLEKAEEYARMLEVRIGGQGRFPNHFLLRLYGTMGKKEELYRAWNTYKSNFPRMHNSGYSAMISSLVDMGDIDGAEKLYKEWLSVKSINDARIGCHLMRAYVKSGDIDKALSFFDRMIETGIKPNRNSWELCAQGHIAERRISDALSCFKEAFNCEDFRRWRPKPAILSAFFKLCQEANDRASKEVLVDLLRQSGCLNDSYYAYIFGLTFEKTSNRTDFPKWTAPRKLE